ncbi:MAG: HAMP domain-containing histidine kinase [Bacteroides sp.]|nr:HAMP domain-containing histidine kinase [Bacteroides sp.]MCM1389101.1 HAMP domain-containing histidine kinase [Bacteroides sp.]
MRLITGFVTFLLCSFAFKGTELFAGPIKYSVKDSLEIELSQAANANDSIRLLYNLYDVSPRAHKYEYSQKLSDIARRTKNTAIQLDILRNNANLYLTSDSMLRIFEKEAKELPESDDQKETALFIKLLGLSYRIKSVTAEKRREIIQNLINSYRNNTDDNIYDRVEKLYSLCLCLSYMSEGDMYVKYINELEKLINEMPHSEGNSLRNMFFNRQAILATMKNDRKKAIEANKAILVIIDNLKEKYHREGRIYKNFDASEYVCRLRLLNNFEDMPQNEIEENYSRILQLAHQNPDVMQDLKITERAPIFYLMAKKEYDKALPILKRHPESMRDQRYRQFYLKYLITASRETGDTKTLLSALEDYNNYLEEAIATEAESKTQELQILYDVESLRRKSMELQDENIAMAKSTNRNIIIGASIVALLLLVFLISVTRMYYKQKKLSRALIKSEKKLNSEKQSLLAAQQEIIASRDEAENANRLKTQFIQNMRHEILTPLNAIVGFSQLIADSIPAEKSAEMEKYTNIIAENNDILHTVITDIIDISQLETGEMKVTYRPESLNEICINTITAMARRTPKNVKMYFDTPKEDLIIYTDRVRVEQVISNFLTNAAKFTESGSITLSYKVDPEKSNVIISVTDTGIGIPVNKQEVIFERFVKLNQYSSGTGLGLHICRLIADILKGTVKVDPTYTDGARFLFIIPLKPASKK